MPPKSSNGWSTPVDSKKTNKKVGGGKTSTPGTNSSAQSSARTSRTISPSGSGYSTPKNTRGHFPNASPLSGVGGGGGGSSALPAPDKYRKHQQSHQFQLLPSLSAAVAVGASNAFIDLVCHTAAEISSGAQAPTKDVTSASSLQQQQHRTAPHSGGPSVTAFTRQEITTMRHEIDLLVHDITMSSADAEGGRGAADATDDNTTITVAKDNLCASTLADWLGYQPPMIERALSAVLGSGGASKDPSPSAAASVSLSVPLQFRLPFIKFIATDALPTIIAEIGDRIPSLLSCRFGSDGVPHHYQETITNCYALSCILRLVSGFLFLWGSLDKANVAHHHPPTNPPPNTPSAMEVALGQQLARHFTFATRQRKFSQDTVAFTLKQEVDSFAITSIINSLIGRCLKLATIGLEGTAVTTEELAAVSQASMCGAGATFPDDVESAMLEGPSNVAACRNKLRLNLALRMLRHSASLCVYTMNVASPNTVHNHWAALFPTTVPAYFAISDEAKTPSSAGLKSNDPLIVMLSARGPLRSALKGSAASTSAKHPLFSTMLYDPSLCNRALAATLVASFFQNCHQRLAIAMEPSGGYGPRHVVGGCPATLGGSVSIAGSTAPTASYTSQSTLMGHVVYSTHMAFAKAVSDTSDDHDGGYDPLRCAWRSLLLHHLSTIISLSSYQHCPRSTEVLSSFFTAPTATNAVHHSSDSQLHQMLITALAPDKTPHGKALGTAERSVQRTPREAAVGDELDASSGISSQFFAPAQRLSAVRLLHTLWKVKALPSSWMRRESTGAREILNALLCVSDALEVSEEDANPMATLTPCSAKAMVTAAKLFPWVWSLHYRGLLRTLQWLIWSTVSDAAPSAAPSSATTAAAGLLGRNERWDKQHQGSAHPSAAPPKNLAGGAKPAVSAAQVRAHAIAHLPPATRRLCHEDLELTAVETYKGIIAYFGYTWAGVGYYVNSVVAAGAATAKPMIIPSQIGGPTSSIQSLLAPRGTPLAGPKMAALVSSLGFTSSSQGSDELTPLPIGPSPLACVGEVDLPAALCEDAALAIKRHHQQVWLRKMAHVALTGGQGESTGGGDSIATSDADSALEDDEDEQFVAQPQPQQRRQLNNVFAAQWGDQPLGSSGEGQFGTAIGPRSAAAAAPATVASKRIVAGEVSSCSSSSSSSSGYSAVRSRGGSSNATTMRPPVGSLLLDDKDFGIDELLAMLHGSDEVSLKTSLPLKAAMSASISEAATLPPAGGKAVRFAEQRVGATDTNLEPEDRAMTEPSRRRGKDHRHYQRYLWIRQAKSLALDKVATPLLLTETSSAAGIRFSPLLSALAIRFVAHFSEALLLDTCVISKSRSKALLQAIFSSLPLPGTGLQHPPCVRVEALAAMATFAVAYPELRPLISVAAGQEASASTTPGIYSLSDCVSRVANAIHTDSSLLVRSKAVQTLNTLTEVAARHVIAAGKLNASLARYEGTLAEQTIISTDEATQQSFPIASQGQDRKISKTIRRAEAVATANSFDALSNAPEGILTCPITEPNEVDGQALLVSAVCDRLWREAFEATGSSVLLAAVGKRGAQKGASQIFKTKADAALSFTAIAAANLEGGLEQSSHPMSIQFVSSRGTIAQAVGQEGKAPASPLPSALRSPTTVGAAIPTRVIVTFHPSLLSRADLQTIADASLLALGSPKDYHLPRTVLSSGALAVAANRDAIVARLLRDGNTLQGHWDPNTNENKFGAYRMTKKPEEATILPSSRKEEPGNNATVVKTVPSIVSLPTHLSVGLDSAFATSATPFALRALALAVLQLPVDDHFIFMRSYLAQGGFQNVFVHARYDPLYGSPSSGPSSGDGLSATTQQYGNGPGPFATLPRLAPDAIAAFEEAHEEGLAACLLECVHTMITGCWEAKDRAAVANVGSLLVSPIGVRVAEADPQKTIALLKDLLAAVSTDPVYQVRAKSAMALTNIAPPLTAQLEALQSKLHPTAVKAAPLLNDEIAASAGTHASAAQTGPSNISTSDSSILPTQAVILKSLCAAFEGCDNTETYAQFRDTDLLKASLATAIKTIIRTASASAQFQQALNHCYPFLEREGLI